ncbi:MAG: T9SS C-terminal target domain-containing protein, partial [Crocinitomicaceae bacterium]|nr:T9SS C-terminal target domain-containing protein [Crocinitomicaceae bacterium]NDC93276.1 T9SS C-terminal target domain-containing protein [Flavobacteriales bacterium]
MKHFYSLFIILSSIQFVKGQVVCSGVSPASIAGNYAFSWGTPANTWGSPDFNIPGTYVQDTLMLVDDGSIGNSTISGVPLANYGCGTLINNLSGKIAVVYRYDGGTASTICYMSEKALIAQNAGAIAVLIVNRPSAGADIGTGGLTVAPNVTIPVVLVNFNDGEILRAEMQNGPVTMFLGNKTGLFANDLALRTEAALIPKKGFFPALLAQNETEFNFDLGARIYNPGNLPQGNVSLRATVTNPAGNLVYDNSVSAMYIDINDSIDVAPGENFTLADFSLSTYPVGTYTLTYTASMMDLNMTNIVDEYASDNSISYIFTISDSIYSAAKVDTANGLPNAKIFYRPSTNNQTYSICSVISDPNASRLAVEGLYFAAVKGTAVPGDSLLTGEEISVYLYKWEDVFVDLNDPSFGFGTLTEVAQAYYYYPSELGYETVFAPFNEPIVLTDNDRYLACVQTVNTNVYFGHDNTNYTWNTDYYLQPICPNENDGTYYTNGFGLDIPNALGIKVMEAVSSTDELDNLKVLAYPNPAINSVTISLKATGKIALTVSDISGKIILNSNEILLNEKAEIDISTLESGVYLLKIITNDGQTSQINV